MNINMKVRKLEEQAKEAEALKTVLINKKVITELDIKAVTDGNK